jgi:hypothetical protein
VGWGNPLPEGKGPVGRPPVGRGPRVPLGTTAVSPAPWATGKATAGWRAAAAASRVMRMRVMVPGGNVCRVGRMLVEWFDLGEGERPAW